MNIRKEVVMPKGMYPRSRNSIQCAYEDARRAMAKFLCCEMYGLPSWLIVHHKDSNVRNNSLGNLQIMSRKTHSRLHLLDTGKYGVREAGNKTQYGNVLYHARSGYINMRRREKRQREKEKWTNQTLTKEQREFLLSLNLNKKKGET